MPLPSIFSGIFSGGASKLIDSVGNIAKDFITTPEQKKEFNEKIQEEINRHSEVMQAQSDKAAEMYLNDVANARAMQIVALNQNDRFAKRFVYFLAAAIVGLAFGFDYMLCFKTIPANNKEMVNIIAGAINTMALASVVSFFFGSSKSSEDKQKQIEKMINEN